jgi:hypothetical protein
LHDRRHFTGEFSRQIAKRIDACGQCTAGICMQRHSPCARLLDRRAAFAAKPVMSRESTSLDTLQRAILSIRMQT